MGTRRSVVYADTKLGTTGAVSGDITGTVAVISIVGDCPVGSACQPKRADGQVAEGCQGSGCGSGPELGVVLVEGHIAPPGEVAPGAAVDAQPGVAEAGSVVEAQPAVGAVGGGLVSPGRLNVRIAWAESNSPCR
jgi:hypothetical protein